MARKKASDGVVATVERVMGKTPCPEFLRSTLNKYLYQEQLFEGARSGTNGGKSKKLGTLRGPGTDNLVRNLLDLDALFLGDTGTVVDIVTGTIPANTLNDRLGNVERDMQQRLEIYSYWLGRISSARAVLVDPSMDLKLDRLDEKLSASEREGAKPIPSFALHALRVQEASEAKARTGTPSATEFVERADAYLALNDLANADRNACAAIEQEAACARGWFIRVAIALRRRHAAMRTFNRKRMEAQEFAEPLSAHESWANEQADEAAGDAWAHQRSLDAILPQAILHWPREAGRPDHANLWKQVRHIFVERMFSIAVHDVSRAGTRQQWAYLNGLEAEWALEQRKNPYAWSRGLTGKSPFTPEETHAIADLLAAYDKKPREFFASFDDSRISTDFRLYHLRYVLRLEGCDAHWVRLRAAVAESPVDWQADSLMRDPAVARLWQSHYCRHDAAPALVESYATWLRQTQARDDGQRRYTVLRQYAYLFHHQFVRGEFDLCGRVAAHALALFDGVPALSGWFGLEQHPYDDSIGMPLHRAGYWEYLAAVAAVEQYRQGGELSSQAQTILADEDRWRKVFSDVSACFWTASEEYEGGGGDDWPEPPYGIDLREENWTKEERVSQAQS